MTKRSISQFPASGGDFALIIDTSGKKVEILLIQGGKLIDSLAWNSTGNLSETLLLGIDKILKRNKVKPQAIGAGGAILGPGSFTGLRIGLSVLNAFGFALGIPLVGIIKQKNLQTKRQLVDLFCAKLKKGEINKILTPYYGVAPKITKPKNKGLG